MPGKSFLNTLPFEWTGLRSGWPLCWSPSLQRRGLTLRSTDQVSQPMPSSVLYTLAIALLILSELCLGLTH